MKTEIEAKFLQVDIESIRERLKSAGAVLKIPMRMMRRVAIKMPWMYENDSFLRIRDEGDKITVTYKQFSSRSVDGTFEIETTVGDFDEAVRLFNAVRLPTTSYQETRREEWELDGAEIVIDEWPWVKPLVEIEADDEAAVRSVAERLGFDWADAVFGSVMRAYEAEYPLLETGALISGVPEVKFGAPIPDMLKS